MLSSIWVATTTGLPAARALLTICFDDLLLQAGNALHRHFHTQVAARHHQPVGVRDDAVEIVDSGRLFDFGHQRSGLTHELTRQLDVLAPLHEGQRDPIDPQAQGVIEIGLVLLGKRPDRQHGIGQTDALAAGKNAADDDGGRDRRGAFVDHAHADLAIIEQQRVTRLDRLEDLRMG